MTTDPRDPIETYEAMVHGQLVTVKRYRAVSSPEPKVQPMNKAALLSVDPSWKESRESTAERNRGSETDYERIRQMPAIDGRVVWKD